MSEATTSKISFSRKLGTFVVGLATVAAALAAVSAEVRAWFGDRLEDVKVAVGAEPAATEPAKKAEQPIDAKLAVARQASAVSIVPGEFRLKLDRLNSPGTIDPRIEANLKIGNNGTNPIEVIWIAPNQNSRVDLQGASAIKRIDDMSGIGACTRADAADCWQIRRSDYTVIDPGGQQIAMRAFSEYQPSSEQPLLGAVKKATIVGKLHIVDKVTGQGKVQNVSMEGIDVLNQIPPAVN